VGPDTPVPLRQLPSVDRLLQGLDAAGALAGYPRSLVVACVRAAVERTRAGLREGRIAPSSVSLEWLVGEARALLAERAAPTLVPAINATGVILHTNLGRAPLCEEAVEAVVAAAGYAVLEVDPVTGERGSRQRHVDALLRELTGADAACAVNNNAAAVLVSLAALAAGHEVVVSRGELIEIGGSFRIPEIMAASACRLVEVGTTNKTYLRDYEAALTPQTALLVKVHRSNFAMHGFVHEVEVRDLVTLGRRAGVPVLFDMGSGALVDLSARGLPREPTASEAIAQGADVVTFSGDKLLGGPQAGLIIGRDAAVQRIRAHPIARAVRIDKLNLAALESTLRVYRDPDRAWSAIPVLRMLSADPAVLEGSARDLAGRLRAALGTTASVDVRPTIAEAGGGALPGVELPSWAVVVQPSGAPPETWDHALRRHRPPVFCRIAEDRLVFDLRTVLPRDLPALEAAVANQGTLDGPRAGGAGAGDPAGAAKRNP
jgi:L-seryl-tRNA(Ser) seleniumtransferase